MNACMSCVQLNSGQGTLKGASVNCATACFLVFALSCHNLSSEPEFKTDSKHFRLYFNTCHRLQQIFKSLKNTEKPLKKSIQIVLS